MEYFFSHEAQIPESAGYQLFDKTHILWFVSAVIITLVIVFSYTRTKIENRKKFMTTVEVILFLCEACRAGWFISIGRYTLKDSLPLQLSRIMLFVEAFAIFTNKRFLKEFSYACGLFAIAAFIFPNTLAYPIIHIHNLRYSVAHILMMSVPLMWIAGDGFRPDVRYLPKSFFLLLCFSLLATVANILFKGNYLHISHVPGHVNIKIGQPWYFLGVAGAILGFWAISYLPWVIREKRLKKTTVNDIVNKK